MLVLITDPAKSNLHPSFKGEVLEITDKRYNLYMGYLIENSLKTTSQKITRWDVRSVDCKILHGFEGDWNQNVSINY